MTPIDPTARNGIDLDAVTTETLAAACRTAAVSSAHADLLNAVAARMLAMLSWIDGAKVDMAALEEDALRVARPHPEHFTVGEGLLDRITQLEAALERAWRHYDVQVTDNAAVAAERDEAVAALHYARAEAERLRTLADDNWRSLEREATEHARTLGLIGQPKTGEPLSEGEQRRFEAAVERGLRKRAEDQRDDWRRRYDDLRDGVLAAISEAEQYETSSASVWISARGLRETVARVEES